jgi:hypothetical protein
VHASADRQEKKTTVKTDVTRSDDGVITVNIFVTGSGKHDIEIRTFNAEAGFTGKQIDLSADKTGKIQLDLKVPDKNRPYVAVISVDNDPDLQKEIAGSFIEPSF